MKTFSFKHSFLVAGVFFCVTMSPLPLHAQNISSGLSVSPAFQEVSLEQGEKEKEFSVALTNNGTVSYRLALSVLDFGSLDEAGGIAFLGGSQDLEKKYALASWMRPETDTLFLAAGEAETVKIIIENRDSLSPGGHYGALIFRVSEDEKHDEQANMVAVNQLFSVLVFAKKVGGEIYALELKQPELPKYVWKYPEEIRLRFQNSGNVHVAPRGKVFISDLLGREVSQATINEESALILPESQRVYPVEVKALARKFFPGKYRVEITYRYDGKEEFEKKNATFYYFPWITSILIVGMMALLWATIVFFRKKTVV